MAHAAGQNTRGHVGPGEQTPQQRQKERSFRNTLFVFGQHVRYFPTGKRTSPLQKRWSDEFFLRVEGRVTVEFRDRLMGVQWQPVSGNFDSTAVPTVISAEVVAMDADMRDRAEPPSESSRRLVVSFTPCHFERGKTYHICRLSSTSRDHTFIETCNLYSGYPLSAEDLRSSNAGVCGFPQRSMYSLRDFFLNSSQREVMDMTTIRPPVLLIFVSHEPTSIIGVLGICCFNTASSSCITGFQGLCYR